MRASLDMDESKVNNFGPYTMALKMTIQGGVSSSKIMPKVFTAYRGLVVNKNELEVFKKLKVK